jgi:histidinol phosphatase-like PHP family hydrolase
MIDLHTHSTFSDGELIPSELVRRAEVLGCKAIAITDHADYTNIEHILICINRILYLEDVLDIKIFPGVELTHVPPQKIAPLATFARKLGAKIIVVHGETPVEPVRLGTNRAALMADIDILAHPGFITQEEAELARDNDICLEITSRSGHNITNGHVVRMAQKAKAKMIVNTDSHAPYDLINSDRATEIAIGAGLSHDEAESIVKKHAIYSEGDE